MTADFRQQRLEFHASRHRPIRDAIEKFIRQLICARQQFLPLALIVIQIVVHDLFESTRHGSRKQLVNTDIVHPHCDASS